jgi:hypothetical protein
MEPLYNIYSYSSIFMHIFRLIAHESRRSLVLNFGILQNSVFKAGMVTCWHKDLLSSASYSVVLGTFSTAVWWCEHEDYHFTLSHAKVKNADVPPLPVYALVACTFTS